MSSVIIEMGYAKVAHNAIDLDLIDTPERLLHYVIYLTQDEKVSREMLVQFIEAVASVKNWTVDE